MPKKKSSDPVRKARKIVEGKAEATTAEGRSLIEETLKRVDAANATVKAQEALLKAASKEARLRVKELSAVLSRVKDDAKAKAKVEKAARMAEKASKKLSPRAAEPDAASAPR